MKTAIRTCLCWLALSAASLLAGCNSVSSQVTVFHDWPADVTEKTYVFDRQAAQQNNLEYDSYAALVRNKLSQTGFTEVHNGNPAFKVALSYRTVPSDVQISPPMGGFYDPYWPWHWRRRFYDPFYPGPYFGPYDPFWPSELDVHRWYRHELGILISDARSGKQLFDIRASIESLEYDLNTQMPNLVQGALKDFPGISGTTRTVRTDTAK